MIGIHARAWPEGVNGYETHWVDVAVRPKAYLICWLKLLCNCLPLPAVCSSRSFVSFAACGGHPRALAWLSCAACGGQARELEVQRLGARVAAAEADARAAQSREAEHKVRGACCPALRDARQSGAQTAAPHFCLSDKEA